APLCTSNTMAQRIAGGRCSQALMTLASLGSAGGCSGCVEQPAGNRGKAPLVVPAGLTGQGGSADPEPLDSRYYMKPRPQPARSSRPLFSSPTASPPATVEGAPGLPSAHSAGAPDRPQSRCGPCPTPHPSAPRPTATCCSASWPCRWTSSAATP